MRGKKIADFLLLRAAFTRQNLSSIAVVLVLLGVYFLFGGSLDIPSRDEVEAGIAAVGKDNVAGETAVWAAESDLPSAREGELGGVVDEFDEIKEKIDALG